MNYRSDVSHETLLLFIYVYMNYDIFHVKHNNRQKWSDISCETLYRTEMIRCFMWNIISDRTDLMFHVKHYARHKTIEYFMWNIILDRTDTMFHVKHYARHKTIECCMWNNVLDRTNPMFHVKHYIRQK